jgi:hypothetical protein
VRHQCDHRVSGTQAATVGAFAERPIASGLRLTDVGQTIILFRARWELSRMGFEQDCSDVVTSPVGDDSFVRTAMDET